jgi:hypothetical protein
MVGSVLGPVKFISYTEEIFNIMVTYSNNHHVFADDEQLYESATVGDTGSARQRLSDCVSDVSASWMIRRRCMNADKTDLTWFGTQSTLSKVAGNQLNTTVDSTIIEPSASTVRDLGIRLDTELTLKQQVSKISSSCFHHLGRLKQLLLTLHSEITEFWRYISFHFQLHASMIMGLSSPKKQRDRKMKDEMNEMT